ncbi:ArsR/SmtB family transcription factor [Staphylococcus felis]
MKRGNVQMRKNNIEVCETFSINSKAVNNVKNEIKASNITEVSHMLKSIADENRAKMTYALCIHEELCVCDIAEILNITVANASHHLRLLYKNGIVTFRKDGKRAFYRLYDEHIRQIILLSIEHKKEVDHDDKD